MNQLTLAIVLFTLGQSLIWIQTNGQFIVVHFDGLLWPGRFIAFGTGMISFVVLTWLFMGEGITTKTAISLVLATTLVSIQIFWK